MLERLLWRPKRSLFAADEDKPLRVALIGCGWYGKTDLFHLIQVAPVEVAGLPEQSPTFESAASLRRYDPLNTHVY